MLTKKKTGAGNVAAVSGITRALDTFAADTADFATDGIYPQYLEFMGSLGYGDEEVETLLAQLAARAGRSS